MNTLLLATQIVCYGASILSASFSIANVVRGWRAEAASRQNRD